MNEIITIGVDLAKNVFQLHGVDRDGQPVLRRQLRRSEMLGFSRTAGLDLSRFDAAPLIAFTATKETDNGTETDR